MRYSFTAGLRFSVWCLPTGLVTGAALLAESARSGGYLCAGETATLLYSPVAGGHTYPRAFNLYYDTGLPEVNPTVVTKSKVL